ncbi:MAG: SUMF1/EgtB/PvdO family nonheme iron enzyme [bacterium]
MRNKEEVFFKINDIYISRFPVTLQEWAEFLESEDYFDQGLWDADYSPREMGDEVLKRIGFEWSKAYRPVTSINWYEAKAFCRARGGRLPWYEEWNMISRMHEYCESNNFVEWCTNWYHHSVIRPVSPSPPLRMRLSGPENCLVPHEYRDNIGFRVVYEHTN